MGGATQCGVQKLCGHSRCESLIFDPSALSSILVHFSDPSALILAEYSFVKLTKYTMFKQNTEIGFLYM